MTPVLRNATVNGELTDIAIEGGLIVALGRTTRPGLDLEGRHVIPGLWDEHVHLAQSALASRRVDVSTAASAAEAAATLAGSPRPGGGVPLVGFGFRDGLWPDDPTSRLLDEHVRDIPAVLVSGDLHCVWLNSAALERFGRAGHPTGVLREHDAFPVTAALSSVPTTVLDQWIADAGAAAAARGVVGVVDFEMADNLVDWPRRLASGFDSLRVDAGVYTAHLDRVIEAGLRTGDRIGEGGLLRVGPWKVLTDGSLNTRTAYCAHDYPGLDGAGARGILTVPTDELIGEMRRATDAGLVPAVHAIGDEANRLALDAFEAVGRGGRIEHAQLLLDADLARFAALGVAASVQPEHAMDDRDVADRYWAGRTGRAFPLWSLLDAGARLLFGSDSPVAPLDPWVTMAAAVGRARDGREPWHPEQAVTIDEALAASTRSSIAVGEPADLVVTQLDPRAATADELRSMPVDGTLLAGRWTRKNL
jgi:predicted amidohydrolase YtcJ